MAVNDQRGYQRGGANNGAQLLTQINEYKEALVAQGLPAYAEMTRQGQGYHVMTSTASTPSAAVPTTSAALEVYNNTYGTVLVIADLTAFQLLATAATQTYGIFAMVYAKAVPSSTAATLYSLDGKPAIVPTASSGIVIGQGTTVVANGWQPFGNPQAWGTNAAVPGNSWSAAVEGKLLVPYGCSLCVQIAGTIATASSFHCGARLYIATITAA